MSGLPFLSPILFSPPLARLSPQPIDLIVMPVETLPIFSALSATVVSDYWPFLVENLSVKSL